jgi:hypothetical protein
LGGRGVGRSCEGVIGSEGGGVRGGRGFERKREE